MLDSYQRTCPGKAAAKRSQAYQVSFIYQAFFPGFAKGYGYGSCRGISITLNVVVHLVVA